MSNGRDGGGEGEGEEERDECDLGDLVTDDLLQLGNPSSCNVNVCVRMIQLIYSSPTSLHASIFLVFEMLMFI